MRYENLHVQRMLAAEYVLGTLRGGARARFVHLLARDAALAAQVTYWERRLGGLNVRIAPVTPRDIVWAQLDRAINASVVAPIRAPRPNLWRAWSVVSTAAALLLAFGLWQEMQRPPHMVEVQKVVAVERPMPYVALLHPDKSEAEWTVSMYPDRAMMKVAARGHYAMDVTQHDLELWLLEAAGPRSLGVLPMDGQMDMPLPAMPITGPLMLAVSLEPKGGSPTGAPTGPVILSAPAVRVL